MAERVASIIHRRAWSKGRRYICKSVCCKICECFFSRDIGHSVWTRLRGSEIGLEDVPVADREHALRFLGEASSDERWMALDEPLPVAFDDCADDDFDFFAEEEYWTCDEELDAFVDVPDIDVQDPGDLKRSRSDEPVPEAGPAKRPKRDKKVKPLEDVCARCHGNGCVRCGWKKNMW